VCIESDGIVGNFGARQHWACSEHWQERVNIEPSAWRTC
jgi:hypothetical protein